MVALTELWLPIVLSAVFVFITSFILHMALQFWHRSDYQKATSESTLADGIKSLTSGQYIVPYCEWGKMTPEEKKAAMSGPTATVLVRNPPPSFPGTLATWFVYCLGVGLFVAYVASVTVARGADYLHVHRVAGAVAFMTWGLGGFSESIWYGRPWRVTFKGMIDGLLYALVTGGTFGWLWPN
jgi:hypothetical protein